MTENKNNHFPTNVLDDQVKLEPKMDNYLGYQKRINREILFKVFNFLPLTIIIIISIIIRLFAAQESLGFIHPDEVFQSIEMVHFKIYGLFGDGATIPWEYNTDFEYGGARSWFFVFLLLGLYRIMMFIGIQDPIVLIYGIRVFLSLFSIITVIVAYLFGKEAFNKIVGLISAFICGTWWFFPFWASRTMTDSISSDLLFLSVYLVYRSFKVSNYRKRLLSATFAGFFVGLAFMIRFPTALMAIPLSIMLIYVAISEIISEKKKTRKKITFAKFAKPFLPFGLFCLSAFAMVAAQGLLDLYTWGSFLHSPINFFVYNIIEGYSAHHGVAPWYHYLSGLFYDFGYYFIMIFLLFFILGIVFGEKAKTKSYMLIICFYWIILFSLLAHKEFRFIMTLLPIAIILVSNGIYKFAKLFQVKSHQYTILSFIMIIFSLSSLYLATVEKAWMWKFNSGICNAMHFVGQQDDAELLIVFEMVWYTGGYVYLDKNISIIFNKIYPLDPFFRINSTYYELLYARKGTYVIIRSYEFSFYDYYNFSVSEYFASQNLHLVANIARNPNAYVYQSG